MKAINTYDTKKNIKLATYASRCIENEILMYFRSNKKNNRYCYFMRNNTSWYYLDGKWWYREFVVCFNRKYLLYRKTN